MEYWLQQPHPMMLVIGTFSEEDERAVGKDKLEFADVRWMEISSAQARKPKRDEAREADRVQKRTIGHDQRAAVAGEADSEVVCQLTKRLVSRSHYSMNTVVSSKGQVVLPAASRERDRVVAGQEFEIERIDAGHYLLKRQPVPDNDGLVDWLLACPEKDWFQPVASETTGSL